MKEVIKLIRYQSKVFLGLDYRMDFYRILILLGVLLIITMKFSNNEKENFIANRRNKYVYVYGDGNYATSRLGNESSLYRNAPLPGNYVDYTN
jgi:hypothetical protein